MIDDARRYAGEFEPEFAFGVVGLESEIEIGLAKGEIVDVDERAVDVVDRIDDGVEEGEEGGVLEFDGFVGGAWDEVEVCARAGDDVNGLACEGVHDFDAAVVEDCEIFERAEVEGFGEVGFLFNRNGLIETDLAEDAGVDRRGGDVLRFWVCVACWRSLPDAEGCEGNKNEESGYQAHHVPTSCNGCWAGARRWAAAFRRSRSASRRTRYGLM